MHTIKIEAICDWCGTELICPNCDCDDGRELESKLREEAQIKFESWNEWAEKINERVAKEISQST